MNGKSAQQTQYKETDTDSCTPPVWREADCYNPKYYTVKPPAQQRVEEEISETVVINNAIQTEQRTGQRSDGLSKLAWLLFGLASLLFLGSMFTLLAYGKSTNTNSVTKETNNTITRTREIIRTERVTDTDDGDPYAPRALW